MKTKRNKKILIPVIKTTYWSWTPEAQEFHSCSKQLRNVVRDCFEKQPEELQRKMTFGPYPGKKEIIERIKIWNRILKPLSSNDYYAAMHVIYKKYIRILRKVNNIGVE